MLLLNCIILIADRCTPINMNVVHVYYLMKRRQLTCLAGGAMASVEARVVCRPTAAAAAAAAGDDDDDDEVVLL